MKSWGNTPIFKAQFSVSLHIFILQGTSYLVPYYLHVTSSLPTGSFESYVIQKHLALHLIHSNISQQIGGGHVEHLSEIISFLLIPLKLFCMMHFMITITQQKLKYKRCMFQGSIFLPTHITEKQKHADIQVKLCELRDYQAFTQRRQKFLWAGAKTGSW